jgi:hypothetical protein
MSKIVKDFIVINNFYSDPYAVRERALNQGLYPFISDIPGQRSFGMPLEESLILKKKFEDILGKSIVNWNTYTGSNSNKEKMNTCFQLVTEGEKTWVHHDSSGWAAVLYLTPEPNPDSGTGLFTHIETGISEWDPKDKSTDFNAHPDRFDTLKWRCNLEVKNQFNRLVLYRGELYHSSMVPGFGNNYVNGRLTQVFFFDV